MATMRVFSPMDLLDYNNINLDPLTATVRPCPLTKLPSFFLILLNIIIS